MGTENKAKIPPKFTDDETIHILAKTLTVKGSTIW